MVPKSKSPNIKNYGSMRERNEHNYKNAKNALEALKKGSSAKNEIFSMNSDFLHCRNCMLIIALSKYGKYSFNK
jgi:multimeric flavodoxin WrbA